MYIDDKKILQVLNRLFNKYHKLKKLEKKFQINTYRKTQLKLIFVNIHQETF